MADSSLPISTVIDTSPVSGLSLRSLRLYFLNPKFLSIYEAAILEHSMCFSGNTLNPVLNVALMTIWLLDFTGSVCILLIRAPLLKVHTSPSFSFPSVATILPASGFTLMSIFLNSGYEASTGIASTFARISFILSTEGIRWVLSFSVLYE